MKSCGFQSLRIDRCRLRFFSTTGSSSCSRCRSVRSCAMAPPSYLYLLVALNISVYRSDIQVVRGVSHLSHRSRCVAVLSPRAFGQRRFPAATRKTTRRSGPHEDPHYSPRRRCRHRSNDLYRRGRRGRCPDVVGQTYNDAKNTIQSTGAAVVIATRTGGRADQETCIVTDAWDKPSVTEPRQAEGPDQVWVALNCNAAIATPGSPGNSAAGP